MGRRGPKPTPTAILKARGSKRAKKRKREPQPPPGMPACPSWLDEEARECWHELAPQLEEMGVLKRIDSKALSRYCHLWARWRRLEQTIAECGETSSIETMHGSYEQQRPEVGIANKLMVQLARLEADFGMTPSARTRVSVTEAKNTTDTNPVTAMLSEDDEEEE